MSIILSQSILISFAFFVVESSDDRSRIPTDDVSGFSDMVHEVSKTGKRSIVEVKSRSERRYDSFIALK